MAKLTIYESAAGRFYVHPEGQRFNTEASFDTRLEAEAYIANPPPAPRTLEGITVLDRLSLRTLDPRTGDRR